MSMTVKWLFEQRAQVMNKEFYLYDRAVSNLYEIIYWPQGTRKAIEVFLPKSDKDLDIPEIVDYIFEQLQIARPEFFL